VVVTVKLKGVLAMALADIELVIAGATPSVRVCEELPATLTQFDSTPP
jgi:hypothetical protein